MGECAWIWDHPPVQGCRRCGYSPGPWTELAHAEGDRCGVGHGRWSPLQYRFLLQGTKCNQTSLMQSCVVHVCMSGEVMYFKGQGKSNGNPGNQGSRLLEGPELRRPGNRCRSFHGFPCSLNTSASFSFLSWTTPNSCAPFEFWYSSDNTVMGALACHLP